MSIDVKKFFRRLARLASFAVKAFQPTVQIEFTGQPPAEYKKKRFRAKFTGCEGLSKGRGCAKYQRLKLACLPIELSKVGFVVQCLGQVDGEVDFTYFFVEAREGQVQCTRPVRVRGVPKHFKKAPASLSHLPIAASQPQAAA